MTPTTSTTPSTIGPYRIDREIGRGGMGVVYLARDTRLDRAVAIKALPEDVASEPERLQRFEREAKLLAALSHPNIAGIYGVEVAGDRRYLALEYIEGESLAERLARGALPISEAIDLGLQIAAGIEAAHEGGIIHRDLKPGNVVITASDQVKVVDFGLAKGRVAEPGAGGAGGADSPTRPDSPVLANSPTVLQSPTIPHSPTLISPATLPGVILGTAAYLSPEQARGKAVDRRTDIWAFGCLLYECLTGKMAFQGETVSDTIAKILERDVDWSLLPKQTPSRIRELLARCLEKDPRRRLRDIGDARLVLEEVRAGGSGAIAGVGAMAGGATAAPAPLGLDALFAGRARALVVIGIFAALAAANVVATRTRRTENHVTRLSVNVPANIRALGVTTAADGRTFVLLGQERSTLAGQEPRTQIYVRRLDQASFTVLPGTERASRVTMSPDSRSLVFVSPVSERSTDQQMVRVSLDGSRPPVTIGKWDPGWTGRQVWTDSGDLLVAAAGGRKYVRVPASGASSSDPRSFDFSDSSRAYGFYSLLPDDRGALLVYTSYEGGVYQQGIGVLDLKAGKTKVLIPNGGSPYYLPTGHLLFTRGGTLLAAPFDAGQLEVKGAPVALLDGLRTGVSWANASVVVSPTGTLVSAPGGKAYQNRHAVVMDASGRVTEWSGERQPFESELAVSPDGNRFASIIATESALYEVWISERGRPASRRAISRSGADCGSVAWSPDGTRLAYTQVARTREDGIYVARAGGSEAPRKIAKCSLNEGPFPSSWSPQGDQILCTRLLGGKAELWLLPVTANQEVEPKPLFASDAQRGLARFSPDGRSISYQSNESGPFEIYVCAWDGNGPVGEPLKVSAASEGLGGGHWSRDGKRIYYLTAQDKVMSVSISTQPHLSASTPTPAWDLDALKIDPALFDILPDGSLLGIRKAEGEDDITSFDVTLNYPAELRAKMR